MTTSKSPSALGLRLAILSNKSSILYNILSYLILDLHSFLLFPDFTLIIKKKIGLAFFRFFCFVFVLIFSPKIQSIAFQPEIPSLSDQNLSSVYQ